MKETIGFVAVDEGVEAALRDAIGPMRRFFVESVAGRRKELRGGVRRVVVTWVQHLVSRPHAGRHGAASQAAATAYLVLVGPGTPVEALSETGRLSVTDRAGLLFVSVDGFAGMGSFLRAVVKRLSLADDSERILHAWWMNGSVQILTTSFRRVDVPRRSIPFLRGLHYTACEELEADLCGTRLVWPRLECELGFDSIACAGR